MDIYTTPGCLKCKQLEKMCNSAGYEVNLIDVSKDFKAMARMHSEGLKSVPIVVHDNKLHFSNDVMELFELIRNGSGVDKVTE